MRLPKIKRKVFLSWLVSYLFILLCSIITSVLIYSSATHVLQKEVQNVSRTSLENMKTLFDGKLRELASAATLLEIDMDIRKAVSYPSVHWDEVTVMNFKRCINLFYRTMASNLYISDIYLYARKSNIILSSRYGYDEDVLEKFPTEGTFGIDIDEFAGLINNGPFYKHVILPQMEKTLDGCILFFYPIGQGNTENDGIIIFQLNTEKLMNLVKGTGGFNNTGFAIIDQYGKTINTEHDFFKQGLLKYSQLGEKPYQHKYNNNNFLIYSTESGFTSWKYVFIYDMQKYLASILYVRNITITFLVVFSLLGVLLSIVLTKHNYNPIQQIIRRISPNISLVGANELQFLEKSINNLFQEKESYSQRLKRQRDVIISSLIVQLLKGRRDSAEKLKELMSVEGLTFKTDDFLVILMSIEDFGILLPEEGEDPDINNAAELSFIVVKNILEEMFGDNQKGIVVEIDTMLACIVNININDDKAAIQNIEKTVKNALEFIKNNFKMIIYASVSNIHTSLYSISKCYQEAGETLERSVLLGSDSIVTIYSNADNNIERAKSGYSRLEKRYMLLNNLMAKNFDNAERIAMDFIDADLKDEAPVHELRAHKYSLIDDLLCALDMFRSDSDKLSLQPANDILMEMDKSKNPATVRTLVQRFFSLLKQLYKDKYDINKLNEKLNDITGFIEKNLTDPDLSVTMLSEHVGLSVSHVTRLLRNKIGLGALEYIQKLRIEKAKRLLCETDQSVNEIAKNVGYYNFRTMNYVFKRLEGITGTQYREQVRKNSKQ